MNHIVRITTPIFVLSFVLAYSALAQRPAAGHGYSARQVAARGTNFFFYIGVYTGPAPNGRPDGGAPSKGIYVARFNPATGDLGKPELAAVVPNPSFLAVSPNRRFLYAATEADPESFVSAYAIDRATGRLRPLNRLPSGGATTAFLSVDKTGRFLLLANYGSRSVSVIQIKADGSLGELTAFMQHSPRRSPRGSRTDPPARPIVAHPHSIVLSPDNRFAIVPDLGLNKIFIYRFDSANGTLSSFPPTTVNLATDEGPRHFVFSPNGKFGYLIAQTSGNVDVFSWDPAQGTLTQIQAVPSFPKGLNAFNMSAEIGMTPDGKFLYESNRRTHGPTHELGPDSIGVYHVNSQTGMLTEVQQSDQDASVPRCFTIDPTGAYLLLSAQQNNRVEVFRIDPRNGELSNTGKSITVHTPACTQFVPALR